VGDRGTVLLRHRVHLELGDYIQNEKQEKTFSIIGKLDENDGGEWKEGNKTQEWTTARRKVRVAEKFSWTRGKSTPTSLCIQLNPEQDIQSIVKEVQTGKTMSAKGISY